MRDAIELEWAGIPSVAIIHEAMAGSADSMKRLSGVKDYDYVEVNYPHIPTAVWTDDEARSIAKDLAPKVMAALTTGSPANATLRARSLRYGSVRVSRWSLPPAATDTRLRR